MIVFFRCVATRLARLWSRRERWDNAFEKYKLLYLLLIIQYLELFHLQDLLDDHRTFLPVNNKVQYCPAAGFSVTLNSKRHSFQTLSIEFISLWIEPSFNYLSHLQTHLTVFDVVDVRIVCNKLEMPTIQNKNRLIVSWEKCHIEYVDNAGDSIRIFCVVCVFYKNQLLRSLSRVFHFNIILFCFLRILNF